MEFGICHLSMIPVRAEASDKAEMVTQVLFGEHFSVIGKSKQWRKITTAFEEYTGWIDEKQMQLIDLSFFTELSKQKQPMSLDLVQLAQKGNTFFPLVLGSTLPLLNNGTVRLGEEEIKFSGQHKLPQPSSESKMNLVETAFHYMESPYLWGGRSPFGIDCSGFTQMVYKLNGVMLRRDASLQAEQGYTLNFLDEAEPGDLAFFDNAEGKIIHVGIILPQGQIIHASGKVRIDKLDHHGIYHQDQKKYSHKLRLVKRIF